MKTKRKALLIAGIIASMLISVAIGQILLTKTLDQTVRVLGEADFVIVRSDTEAEITAIAWGDFLPLGSKNTETLLGCFICIINTGNVPLVIGWNTTGLDTGRWTITATWGGASHNPYPPNDYNQFRIDQGYINGFMVFTLSSIDPYHPPGDYAFTLNFHAQQAP